VAQYREGAVDFTRVTQIQQNLVSLQDVLAQARGEIGLGLIQAFRALGGGWEIRLTGCEPAGTATSSEPPASPVAAPAEPVSP
jgi:hypothetical protein